MPVSKHPFLLKSEQQLVYAIVLIILIPLAIILNTIWSVQSFKGNIDIELQRQALSIARFFNETVFKESGDRVWLQEKTEAIAQANLDIHTFDILLPEGEDFKIIASLEAQNLDQIKKDLNYVIAWHQEEAIATLVYAFISGSQGPKERFWEIALPLTDAAGEKQALLTMRLSLEVMDRLVKDTLTKSYLILSLTVLAVVLLLALNTRLFEHAILFKKLKEVDEMKDEFISIASHELRTPITTLKGFLSMILEGDYGSLNEEGRKSLQIMASSVNRLGNLVEDLLNVSRIEQKRLQFSPQAIKLSEVLASLTEEFELRVQEKGLRLALDASPDLALAWADEDKLRQVLINLVGNSVKYTKQGQIELSAKSSNDKFLTITVKDSGLGMSAEETKDLFSKFYRVKNEDTRGIVGTGLGLWITKQLVEMMGGQIYVESIKHVGTQIYFTMPVYDKNKHHMASKEEKRPGQ